MSLDAFLVASNAIFWLPMVEAIRRHRWTRATVYFLIVPISGLYHLCDSAIGACLVVVSIHHHLDFFFSQLLIVLTALYFIDFGSWSFLERILIIFGALGIFFIEALTPTQLLTQALISGASLLLVCIYVFLYHPARYGRVPDYHWPNVTWGIIFIALGCLCFALINQTSDGNYWWLHSMWHIFAGIGQFFILRIRDPVPAAAAIDSKVPEKSRPSHHRLLDV